MDSKILSCKIEERLKSHKADLAIKRIFDVAVSLVLFILLLPLLASIAIAIKLDSKGPFIFKQKRIGYRGKPFTILKFRTMVKDAEASFKLNLDKENIGSFVFQDKNDPRVTRVGNFLRRTSLDELPQLINVLLGEMSLVGPRPEIPDVADYYNDVQRLRLSIKPGITGLAQVSGRGEIELDETIGYDLEYITSFNIWLDFKVILRTVTVVFKREGAF